ncbi:MAG: glycerol kinase GlpK [SAR324 cluster bacterium]|nr:glycerol kinase GlpK [SAR324 cluster bacterium]
MSKVIMALDQGTTSSRTILFNEDGSILSSAGAEFDCYYPQDGWVEQNPMDLWQTQLDTIHEAVRKAGISLSGIHAIGITNQRETVVAWNKKTGEPLHNAIVWQCRRSADYCEALKREGFDQVLRQKTGLVTDAYFSGTKMRWLLKNNEEAALLAKEGNLALGTVDSWLIWKLTGGQTFATDVSNASRTQVFNIHELQWDQEILEKFEIPASALPQVMASSGVFGVTDSKLLGCEIPIAGVAGDQHAALFGQACFEPGMVKNTYGTGCFMLVNTGNKAAESQNGLLTTIAWKIGDQVTYALEGSVFIAGALIQWLRDDLGLFQDASETEAMALSVADSQGVYIVPAFVGLGAPFWDAYARGSVFGLTRGVNKNHIARSALEAICFQTNDILRCMEQDMGQKITKLRVDGGACRNQFLCQFQADILSIEVNRPEIIETTAMGAAFLAGLATQVWGSLEEIEAIRKENAVFHAKMKQEKVNSLLEGWNKAVGRSKNWLSEQNV